MDPEERGSEFRLNLGACVTNCMMSELKHSTGHCAIRRDVAADSLRQYHHHAVCITIGP